MPVTRRPNPRTLTAVVSRSALGQPDYICDGTDDHVQIQAAIDAVEAAGGGNVLLREGAYDIGSPIVISLSKYLTLEGSGWDTVLTAKNALNDNVIEFNPPADGVWCRISNMKIDGNGNNQSTAGNNIYAFGALQCIFENLWITQPFNNGIFLYQDGAAGTGHHSRIINCLFDEGDNTNGGDGRALRIEANDEVMVVNCDFESNGRAAASEPNHIYDLSGLNSYVGCAFVGGETGIKVQGAYSRIIGCIFDGTKNHSIRLNGDRNVVMGNSIFSPGFGSGSASFDGIFVDNVANNMITGNVIRTDNTGTRSGINFANGATSNSAISNDLTAQGSGYGTSAIIVGTGNQVALNNGYSTDISVPDEAYGAGWNASLEVPTKNAVYDKIETITGSSGISESLAIAYAVSL